MGRRQNCQLSKITNELQLGAIFYYLTLEWAFLIIIGEKNVGCVEGQTAERVSTTLVQTHLILPTCCLIFRFGDIYCVPFFKNGKNLFSLIL